MPRVLSSGVWATPTASCLTFLDSLAGTADFKTYFSTIATDDGLYAYGLCNFDNAPLNRWDSHLNVFDISTPSSLSLVVDYTLANPTLPLGGEAKFAKAYQIVVFGNRAYILWADQVNTSLHNWMDIYDISTPGTPSLLSSTYLPRNVTTMTPPYEVSGTRYIACTDASDLTIYSVVDGGPSVNATTACAAPIDTQRYGNYLLTCYVNDSNDCLLWDVVSDPSTPTLIGTATHGTGGDVDTALTSGIQGTSLYVTYDHFDVTNYSQIVTFDISTPATPTEVGAHYTDSVIDSTDATDPNWLSCQTANFVYVENLGPESLQGLNATVPASLTYCDRAAQNVTPDYLLRGALRGYSDLLLLWGDQTTNPTLVGAMLRVYRGS